MSPSMDTSAPIVDEQASDRSYFSIQSHTSSDEEMIECKRNSMQEVFLTPRRRKHRTKHGTNVSRSYPLTRLEKRSEDANNCVEASCMQISGKFIQSKSKLRFSSNCLKIAFLTLTPQCKVSIHYSDIQKISFSLKGMTPYHLVMKVKTRDDHFALLYNQHRKRPRMQQNAVYDIKGGQSRLMNPLLILSFSIESCEMVFYFENLLEFIRCKSITDGNSVIRKLLNAHKAKADTQDSVVVISSPPRDQIEQKWTGSPSTFTEMTLSSREDCEEKTIDSLDESFTKEDRDSTTLDTNEDGSVHRRIVFPDMKPNDDLDSPQATLYSVSSKQSDEASPPSFSYRSRRTRKQRKAYQENEDRRSDHIVLTYPFQETTLTGRVGISSRDLDRLEPGHYLNDNIIDFYLHYSWRHLPVDLQDQVYIFSSHFFSHLFGSNDPEVDSVDVTNRFDRISRWVAKDMNLFEKRFLLVPINDSFHWSIVIICNPGSSVSVSKHESKNQQYMAKDEDVIDLMEKDYFDDHAHLSPSKSKERNPLHPPCILFLDSLDCHRKETFCALLRRYLEMEYNRRRALLTTEKSLERFDPDQLILLTPPLPMQDNSVDCGVYVLLYANAILKRLLPIGITRDHIESEFHGVLSSSLFTAKDVTAFRDYLQQLVYSLQAIQLQDRNENAISDEGLEHFYL
ncbi:unnamed protein product [Albugo candida]|uniref:Ubiquitin-like protease family profile domain-containing protein n=2 Tax=Albugo candida TaxID=65357 RepID=A0A024GVB1_9STRA|nr:unnamed protein product [Albugo candida]|eukprot:CCI50525.1 unnamed protein product [Albugo candida]